MNQNNFEYLRDQLKYTGFGDVLEEELKVSLQKQLQEFTLYHNAKYGNDRAAVSLHFSKSKQRDLYFFNSYQFELNRDKEGKSLQQRFYINKDNKITLKEAYNLMSGRAINKVLINREGRYYVAWLEMNFKQTDGRGNYKVKQYHPNYGYDLEEVLSSYPIAEIWHLARRRDLMDSLKKGNLQAVTFHTSQGDQEYFIEANPKFKTLTIYDSGMKLLRFRRLTIMSDHEAIYIPKASIINFQKKGRSS